MEYIIREDAEISPTRRVRLERLKRKCELIENIEANILSTSCTCYINHWRGKCVTGESNDANIKTMNRDSNTLDFLRKYAIGTTIFTGLISEKTTREEFEKGLEKAITGLKIKIDEDKRSAADWLSENNFRKRRDEKMYRYCLDEVERYDGDLKKLIGMLEESLNTPYTDRTSKIPVRNLSESDWEAYKEKYLNPKNK